MAETARPGNIRFCIPALFAAIGALAWLFLIGDFKTITLEPAYPRAA